MRNEFHNYIDEISEIICLRFTQYIHEGFLRVWILHFLWVVVRANKTWNIRSCFKTAINLAEKNNVSLTPYKKKRSCPNNRVESTKISLNE